MNDLFSSFYFLAKLSVLVLSVLYYLKSRDLVSVLILVCVSLVVGADVVGLVYPELVYVPETGRWVETGSVYYKKAFYLAHLIFLNLVVFFLLKRLKRLKQ